MPPLSVYRLLQVEVRDYAHAAQPLARVAYFRDIPQVEVDRRDEQIDTISFRVVLSEPALAHLKDDHAYRALRTQRLGGGDAEMWQVTSVTRSTTENGEALVEIKGRALWGHLGGAGKVKDVLEEAVEIYFGRYDHTPTELVELALAGYTGPVHFEIGTIGVTEPIEYFEFKKDSPYAAIQRIAKAADARVRFTWDDSLGTVGGYRLDIEDAEAGALLLPAEARRGKNLKTIAGTKDLTNAYTRFYPTGAEELTLAECEWVVSGVAGNVLTLTDDGGTRGPIPEDNAGWFVGCRIRKMGTSGAGIPISDSAGSLDGPGTVTVPGIAGIVEGDRVQFLDSDGVPLLFIEHPRAKVVGIHDTDRETETVRWGNLIRNPKLDNPLNAPVAPHWFKVGNPTLSRVKRSDEPEWGKYGSYGIRVIATAAGQGVCSEPFDWIPTEKLSVLNIVASIFTGRGAMQCYLQDETDSSKKYPGDKIWYAEHGSAVTGDPYPHLLKFAKTERRSDEEPSAPVPPAGRYRFYAVSQEPGEWVLDGASASPAIGDSVQDLAVDGGGQQLWIDAVKVALLENTPFETLEIDLLHLYRLDPERYADERWEINRAIRIFDEELGIAAEYRITGVAERLDGAEAQGKLTLSTERRDIRDLLGGKQVKAKNLKSGVQGQVVAIVKPTKLIYRDPPPDGNTVVEFGIGKGQVLTSGAFAGEYDPHFLIEKDRPEDWLPTAVLKSTGAAIPVTADLRGTDPKYWIFVVEPFPADQKGDVLLITVPSIRGVVEGTSFPLEILSSGQKYTKGGRCGPGYYEVLNADGTYRCVLEGEVGFPEADPVADFQVLDTADPYIKNLNSTSTPDPAKLAHSWLIGAGGPPPTNVSFSVAAAGAGEGGGGGGGGGGEFAGPSVDFSRLPAGSVQVGQVISFTDETTGGTAPYSYTWQFIESTPLPGGGTEFDTTTSHDQNPTHAFQTAGTREVLLTVFDADGNYDSKSVFIEVLPA